MLFLTASGVNSAHSPRIRKIFRTLEPSTLPMASPALSFTADVILIAASGALVPNATIVKPMTI